MKPKSKPQKQQETQTINTIQETIPPSKNFGFFSAIVFQNPRGRSKLAIPGSSKELADSDEGEARRKTPKADAPTANAPATALASGGRPPSGRLRPFSTPPAAAPAETDRRRQSRWIGDRRRIEEKDDNIARSMKKAKREIPDRGIESGL